MLTRAASLAGLAALVALVSACGKVVETGPGATPGEGFEEIVVQAPATTSAPTTAEPGASTPTTVDGGGGTAGASTTVVPTDPSDVLFEAGSCLTWDQTGTTAGFDVVTCEQEHLAEVAGAADLTSSFGPDAPYPSDDELRSVVSAACTPIVQAYLGRDVADQEEPGVISPSEDGWAQGERVVYCTVGLGRQDGRRPPYTGHLTDRPTS